MSRSQLKKQAQKDTESHDLSGRLVTLLEPDSGASEAYRTLRTSLLYAVVDTPPRMVVVTSPGASEGKSTVCANLGVVLAQAGKNTLLVDCDFRKPVMHKVFGVRSTHGVVDVLIGQYGLHEAYREPLPNLKVLAAGVAPPDPAEILGSRRLSEFFATAREEFDYVLVDSSPVGMVSDAAVLAAQGDGVLLALDAQKTRKADVRRSVRSLKAVGANVLGTVMNNVKGSKGVYY